MIKMQGKISNYRREEGCCMTIYDIAKEAGVSASSVSRVINNRPGVNAATRQKIVKLMEKYNYSPNAIARGLVSQSSKTIGILVADIRNIHHTDGAYYIEREMAKLGYCCIILNTGNKEEDKVSAIQMLERRRVEGVVMMGSVFQSEEIYRALENNLSNVPVVMVNGWLKLPNVYGILSDEQGGVEQCVQFLASKGRSRIAFVCDIPFTPSNLLKEKGYLNSMHALGMDGREWSYQTDNTLEGGYEATMRLLKDHPNVDGIVYSVDLLATGGLHALAAKRISVPSRVAVIGINNSMYAEICTPRLTSLDNKRLDSSILAVRTLTDCLSGRKVTRRMMLLPDLVERDST